MKDTDVRRAEDCFRKSIEVKEKFLADGGAALLEQAARMVAESLRRKGCVYFFGNGGSAADAQHLAGELVGRFTMERRALAAAALGLGTQWVTVHIEDGFKRILNVPDVLSVYTLIPVGYPDVPRRKGLRRPLAELIHHNRYERSKYLSNRQIVEYIAKLRRGTKPKYSESRGEEGKKDPHTEHK